MPKIAQGETACGQRHQLLSDELVGSPIIGFEANEAQEFAGTVANVDDGAFGSNGSGVDIAQGETCLRSVGHKLLDQVFPVKKLPSLNAQNSRLAPSLKGGFLDLGARESDLTQDTVLIVDVIRRF